MGDHNGRPTAINVKLPPGKGLGVEKRRRSRGRNAKKELDDEVCAASSPCMSLRQLAAARWLASWNRACSPRSQLCLARLTLSACTCARPRPWRPRRTRRETPPPAPPSPRAEARARAAAVARAAARGAVAAAVSGETSSQLTGRRGTTRASAANQRRAARRALDQRLRCGQPDPTTSPSHPWPLFRTTLALSLRLALSLSVAGVVQPPRTECPGRALSPRRAVGGRRPCRRYARRHVDHRVVRVGAWGSGGSGDGVQ